MRKRIPHGNWLDWLQKNFEWTDDTALNYIQFFRSRRQLKSRTVRDLPLGALFVLARESTPPAVIREVSDLAKSGRKVTRSITREIIKQHATAPTPVMRISAAEKPVEKGRTLTTADLHRAAAERQVAELPQWLVECHRYLGDLPDEVATMLPAAGREMVVKYARATAAALEALAKKVGRPKLVKSDAAS